MLAQAPRLVRTLHRAHVLGGDTCSATNLRRLAESRTLELQSDAAQERSLIHNGNETYMYKHMPSTTRCSLYTEHREEPHQVFLQIIQLFPGMWLISLFLGGPTCCKAGFEFGVPRKPYPQRWQEPELQGPGMRQQHHGERTKPNGRFASSRLPKGTEAIPPSFSHELNCVESGNNCVRSKRLGLWRSSARLRLELNPLQLLALGQHQPSESEALAKDLGGPTRQMPKGLAKASRASALQHARINVSRVTPSRLDLGSLPRVLTGCHLPRARQPGGWVLHLWILSAFPDLTMDSVACKLRKMTKYETHDVYKDCCCSCLSPDPRTLMRALSRGLFGLTSSHRKAGLQSSEPQCYRTTQDSESGNKLWVGNWPRLQTAKRPLG